jgi:hypothetical protein
MMEQNELNEFFRITKILSDFIKTNNIDGKNHGPQFIAVLKRLMKIHSTKNMKDLLNFNHYLNAHEENSMKLQCGAIHCIQCYRQLVEDDFYEPGRTQCTCLQIISPIYRKRILENHKRIEALRTLCIYCNKRKDNMRFVLKSLHNCHICTDCLKQRFNYYDKENKCSNCNEVFNEDCDTLIRDIIETEMDPADVKANYTKECPKCNKRQDSREFIQICVENKCKVCKPCTETLKKENVETCLCGDRISVLA